MRFDSAEHLQAWQERQVYPEIHRKIRESVVNLAVGSRLLDLCCSYGLIGQFLQDAGFTAVGVDRDVAVIERARAADIRIPLYRLEITRETVHQLYEIIENHRITGIVARRALPELFADDLEFGREFFAEMRDLGVRELFLEGRVATRNAVSALASLDAEIKLVAGSYAWRARFGSVAYLRARELA